MRSRSKCRVPQALQNLTNHRALVDRALGQRLIFINVNRLAGIQCSDLPGPQRVPNIHDAFFHRYDGGLIIIVDADVEGGSTNRNHGGWSYNPVGVGLPSPLLDVYFDPSNQNVQKIAPVSRVLPEDHIRVWINIKSASVGNLELSEAVRPSDNDLAGLDFIADIEGPRLGIFQRRHLPGQ